MQTLFSIQTILMIFQTRGKLDELEEQLEVTVAKTQRKVNNLKSQFQEHKGKWESVS